MFDTGVWPSSLPAPGTPGWQHAAAAWARTQVPARIADHPHYGSSPGLLLWLGRTDVAGRLDGVRSAQTIVNRLTVPPTGPGDVLVGLAAEVDRLTVVAQQMRAVDRALSADRWGGRPS